jgi:hypothetical protein
MCPDGIRPCESRLVTIAGWCVLCVENGAHPELTLDNGLILANEPALSLLGSPVVSGLAPKIARIQDRMSDSLPGTIPRDDPPLRCEVAQFSVNCGVGAFLALRGASVVACFDRPLGGGRELLGAI